MFYRLCLKLHFLCMVDKNKLFPDKPLAAARGTWGSVLAAPRLVPTPRLPQANSTTSGKSKLLYILHLFSKEWYYCLICEK